MPCRVLRLGQPRSVKRRHAQILVAFAAGRLFPGLKNHFFNAADHFINSCRAGSFI
jgi:hypothetical protein